MVLEVFGLAKLVWLSVVELGEPLVEVEGVTEAEELVCPLLEAGAAELVDESVNVDVELKIVPLGRVVLGMGVTCGPGSLGKAASAIARGKTVNEKSDIQREVFIASVSK